MLIESWLCTFSERVQDLRDEATTHGFPAAAERLDAALLECRVSIETNRILRTVIESAHPRGKAAIPADRITRLVLEAAAPGNGRGDHP